MKERDIYRIYKPPMRGVTHSVEIKLTKTQRLSYSALAPHQEESLIQSLTGHWFKIPDPIGGMGVQLPYDVIYVKAEEAFVAVMYYVPRKPKVLYFIRIQEWINQRKNSKHKSLHRSEAEAIASYAITL